MFTQDQAMRIVKSLYFGNCAYVFIIRAHAFEILILLAAGLANLF